MNDLDLSILEKIPNKSKGVVLIVQPLAPLSMVGDLPGAFYKTLKSPSKKMLCGLFENVLGWHIDIADRMQVVKRLKKIRKKQKVEYIGVTGGSTYIPLLYEYFDIELVYMGSPMFYNDYWSKSYRRADAVVHPKGTANISAELIPLKRELKRNDKNPKIVDDKALEPFFKENIGGFPIYYSTPVVREYLALNDSYQIKLIIDPELFLSLKQTMEYNNISYLGNSEGWVHLAIQEL